MPNPLSLQHAQGQATLETTDATKTIIPSPGLGKKLYITHAHLTVLVSAAQTLDLESSDGAVEIIRLAASPAANSKQEVEFLQGFALPENTGLVVTPSAIGPSVHVAATGFISG